MTSQVLPARPVRQGRGPRGRRDRWNICPSAYSACEHDSTETFSASTTRRSLMPDARLVSLERIEGDVDGGDDADGFAILEVGAVERLLDGFDGWLLKDDGAVHGSGVADVAVGVDVGFDGDGAYGAGFAGGAGGVSRGDFAQQQGLGDVG